MPQMPDDLKELRGRITRAFTDIKSDILGRKWEKLDFRTEVCRITNGAFHTFKALT